VTRITEGIIGDDSAFDEERIAPGWSWNYLDTWYAAETSGLCLNDNCYDVRLAPGTQVGTPIRFSVRPSQTYGEWNITATTTNRARTRGYADSLIQVQQTPGGEAIEIAGSMPLNSYPCEKTLPVKNPTRFFLSELHRVLSGAGIQVGPNLQDIGSVKNRNQYTPSAMPELAVYTSPPRKDIITVTNKKSINLYAEQMFKTLGRRGGTPGSFQNGFAVVQQFLSKNGVATPGFYMADGSGLSAHDMVRPRHMLGLLKTMHKHPARDVFYASLPVAGLDGTLQGRLGEAPALGKVHAKTGFIRQAMCLSGYIENRAGENFAFTIMVSLTPEKAERIIPAIDKIVLRLAQFPLDKTAK
jgi:D-alanyl-D-alanine carboxypeptidase/D-alanyl-D-alanine-endopeptidase (penicillin-binding protein 4)